MKAKHSPLEAALQMGENGYRVVPIGAGQKFPPIQEWQKQATDDQQTLERWFASHPEWGLGWKMGLQADGRYLVAVDVDVKSGGVESLNSLLEQYQLTEEFFDTVRARTGGGGMHFVFEFDPAWIEEVGLTNRARLAPGIDIRAEAGQIVVYPTIHPETGKPYFWADGHAPWALAPSQASETLCSALAGLMEGESGPANAPQPTMYPQQRGFSPADWVRDHLDWEQALLRHGWTPVDGGWRRPGKTDKGKSAVLHEGGPLVIFTTEIPPELASVAKPTRGGEGHSVSLFSFLAAYEARGDEKAYARQVCEEYGLGGLNPVAAGSSGGGGGTGGSLGEPLPSTVHLADWFWTDRPVLTAIRDAARARMVSPDALFLNILLRWAALVPPCYKLPAVIGDEATFDLIGVVVANTSGGKSAANRVSKQMVRNLDPAIMFDYPIGSGEGLVTSYMEMVEHVNDEGKKERSLRVTKRGLHFTIDEGVAFLSMGQRKGTTLMPTLTAAWSGSALGQANASAETRRIIEGGRVRLAVAINMQESNAWKLFEDEISDLGLTGRMIFASAHDAGAIMSEFSGDLAVLPFPPLPIIETGRTVAYADPAIPQQIRQRHFNILTGQLRIDPLESHQMLIQCKVAGVLALQDGRSAIEESDWTLAQEVVRASSAVLSRLRQVRHEQLAQKTTLAATAAAQRELIAEDVKEARAVNRLRDSIVAKVRAAGGSLTVLQTKRATTSSTTRHRFDDALSAAVGDGLVAVDQADGSGVIRAL